MFRLAAVTLLLAVPVSFAADLPIADEVEWKTFRAHVLDLLKGLEKLKVPLPIATDKAVRALLVEKPADEGANAKGVQKLLDARCLIGVTINPESRVKATRGPLAATLARDKVHLVLVKVTNEGGVTHPLRVASEQFIVGKKGDDDRWLTGAVVNQVPFANRLSGKKIEYRVLRMTPRQTGKREATLVFDVGQGTQDLGFRAEVPILFTIKAR